MTAKTKLRHERRITYTLDVQGEVISRDEAIRRYPGESIVMQVAEIDDGGWPSLGVVVMHMVRNQHNDRVIAREVGRLIKHKAPSSGPFYVFNGHPRDSWNPTLEKAAERLVAQASALIGDRSAGKQS